MNFSYYFLIFFIYSVLGWLVEVADIYLEQDKLVNRGFLIGPYCPIYGIGAILVANMLKNYLDSPLVVFSLSIIICSIVEYFGSYILEKIFHTSWWNYSNKKYNINGRICLETMSLFGIGCLIMVYVLNPVFSKLLLSLTSKTLNILAIIFFTLFMIDVIISFKITWKFKKVSENTSIDSKIDNTEKITKYVKEQIISHRKKLEVRLVNAFPRLKVLKFKKNK